MRQDLLNDALLALRHADLRGQETVTLRPISRLVGNVLGILREHGYIGEFHYEENGQGGAYAVALSRRINSCGVLKPRLSVGVRELERYESRYLPAQDFGLLILTTSRGVVSQTKARELGIGGKLLAYVY
ncbi:MAG: 30S ribosomal protein S8 [Euryarchaeota archaeon]|nr:30S ribosomal protein S8 [Euryarchaeota archaeon]MDE1835724.1 30S ribosomal protein S8 [Euryarchaeota archaeon]MDE1880851.1 30S ribosomal protein S8 [Euryarchaeota archaeon]MDE2043915.1 30S ribosomal protein S8 [Thermoplasmata archaeon]